MNRKNIWMRTLSGKVVHPFDPHPDQICLDDIAKHLARIPRFCGGVKWPLHYSVLEHSVILARYALKIYPDQPTLALQLLAHDFAEYIMNDTASPIKNGMAEYSEIEHRILFAIFEKYNIPFPPPPLVKELDTRIILDEEAQALEPGERDFHFPDHQPLGVTLHFWTAEQAHMEFFTTWCEIWRRETDHRLQAYEARLVG